MRKWVLYPIVLVDSPFPKPWKASQKRFQWLYLSLLLCLVQLSMQPPSSFFTESFSGILSRLDNRVTYDNGPTNPPTTFSFGPKYLTSYLYQLSPIQDWVLATTVVRPLCYYSMDDVSKEIVLSSKKYGSVRRVFIVADEDKTIPKEFQHRMIEKNPPDEVKEISDSDHMAMMSKPQQLFTLLLGIANK